MTATGKPPRAGDLHPCELGERTYWFRTPTAFDLPGLRHVLARRGIRRPHPAEVRIAALKGLEALGAQTGEETEALRQRELMEHFWSLLEPIREDDLDEPDFEKRAAELAAREAARSEALGAVAGEALAIEALLTRHWPPYAELLADRALWDDVTAIEIVRQFLCHVDDAEVPRDRDGWMTDAAFQKLPRADRGALAAFANGLLMPTEEERKN